MTTPIPPGPRRAGPLALMLLACVTLACRTAPRAAPSSTPPTASTPPQARGESPSVVLDGPSRLLLTPPGNAYLVLRAGPEERDHALAWDVLFVAGLDATLVDRPDTPDRLAVAATELLGAYGPFAEAAGFARISTTAIFGRPGEAGAAVRYTFTRDALGWNAPASGERASVRVPPVHAELARYPDEEVAARSAAERFMSDVDRADYDAAWARTSALAKAAMSRAEFERQFARRPRADADHPPALYVAFACPMGPPLPGASALAWATRTTAAGPTIDVLFVRLDDDIEWRVAAVAQWIAQRDPAAANPEAPSAHQGT